MSDIQPSSLLEEQHRQLDRNMELLLAGQGDPGLLQADLRRHLYIEEALLFPLVNGRRLAMPLGVMREEHGQMWDLLAVLDETTDAVARRCACQQLFDLFAQHNPKEEDVIYPAIDDYHANDHQPGSLLDDIDGAELPDGWVCGARRQA